MAKDVDLDYLKFIRSELLNRRHSHGHTHVDLEWLLKRLERGFTGVEPEPIQELDPEVERKRFSEDSRRVGLVGASNLATSRRLRASLGDAEYTFNIDVTDRTINPAEPMRETENVMAATHTLKWGDHVRYRFEELGTGEEVVWEGRVLHPSVSAGRPTWKVAFDWMEGIYRGDYLESELEPA